MAGLRGFDKFVGVDQAFLGRIRQLDPAIDNVGIVAETYDAVVTLLLAARVSGRDGPGLAPFLADVTRFGTTCTTPEQCLATVATGGDIDYDGPSGRIELSDGGERTTSRWEVWEVNRTGTVDTLPIEETDVGDTLFSLGLGGSTVPEVRPDDGVLRIGALVVDPRGTLVPRIEAAGRLAVGDATAAAGGVGVPVELLPPVDSGPFPDDQEAAARDLVAAGVDAVVVTSLEDGARLVFDQAGVLQLHVTGTEADEIIAEEGDPAFDELGFTFGFGPSLAAHAALVGQLVSLDGCRDVVLVTTDGTDPLRDTTALGDLFEQALGSLDVGVAERLAIPPVDPEVEITDTTRASGDAIAEALEDEGCAVFAVDEPDGNLAMVLAVLAEEGVGPHERFLYLVDTNLSVELLDLAEQLEGEG